MKSVLLVQPNESAKRFSQAKFLMRKNMQCICGCTTLLYLDRRGETTKEGEKAETIYVFETHDRGILSLISLLMFVLFVIRCISIVVTIVACHVCLWQSVLLIHSNEPTKRFSLNNCTPISSGFQRENYRLNQIE